MNEITESGGSAVDKSAALNKSLRTTLEKVYLRGELFPRKTRPSEVELVEKELAATQSELERRRGASDPPVSPSASEKAAPAAAEGLSVVEKALRKSGFDKLPMTDRARDALEGALANGAEPVTQYTGKVMIDRGVPEIPPASLVAASDVQKGGGALDRPSRLAPDKPGPLNLRVGDRVVPLQWVDIGPYGAKFDLPFVPPVGRVTKLYVAPASVTKDAYPPGRAPEDVGKAETVVEDRLWAMEVEPEGDAKEASDRQFPVITKDTTMVLRLEPLAAPSGEV